MPGWLAAPEAARGSCLSSALGSAAASCEPKRSLLCGPAPRPESAAKPPPAPLEALGEASGDAAIACWRSLRGSTAAVAGGAPRGGRPTGGAPRGGGPEGTLPAVGGGPRGGGPRGGGPAGMRDISEPCVDAMSQPAFAKGANESQTRTLCGVVSSTLARVSVPPQRSIGSASAGLRLGGPAAPRRIGTVRLCRRAARSAGCL